jgi:diguanylate cyclase (GGDEF)-like protein
MDMRSIYIPNCIGVVILFILFFTSRTQTSRRRTEDKIFFCMVFGVMLGCLAEMFSYAIDGRLFPGARLLNYAANTYLYTVNLLLPFCLLVYVDLGLYDDTGRIWKHYKPQIIVGGVMFAINILNLVVPISFYITGENMYERRPFSYVYYAVILYYCLTAALETRRYEKKNGARTFISVEMFLLPILAGAGLQFLIYGLSLAWLSAAIGLAGLFMMQQNEMAYVDTLTDTFNRLYLNHTLSAWISRGSGFSGAMVDLDGFKSINDNFGHSEGDRALKAVADAMKKARSDNELVFRFAGDEFIVLKISGDEDSLHAYMAEVRRLLAKHREGGCPYEISLSYGVSSFDAGSADAFMKEMDDKMYRMKVKHHEELGIVRK